MKKIESSLYHIIQPPRTPIGEKHPTILMLHGRGADEHDLPGLSDYLDGKCFIISARAPYSFQYGGGYTWYDILDIGKPEPKMFAESFRKLNQFIDDIKKNYPIDPSKLFLLGFSMGTVMAYALALTTPAEFAGVIANSGYIPEETDLIFQWHEIRSTAFFVAHGAHDPVIPVTASRRARMLLEQANAQLVYKEYPMAHQISEQELTDMAEWLAPRL